MSSDHPIATPGSYADTGAGNYYLKCVNAYSHFTGSDTSVHLGAKSDIIAGNENRVIGGLAAETILGVELSIVLGFSYSFEKTLHEFSMAKHELIGEMDKKCLEERQACATQVSTVLDKTELINSRLNATNQSIANTGSKLASFETEITTTLNTRIEDVNHAITTEQVRLNETNSRLDTVNTSVGELGTNITSINTQITRLDSSIREIDVGMENVLQILLVD
ncbi:hypothetical protein [Dongshaea marina]|uniref:hypothetical protein n=1 Tax=Dongshaea marina TaxID=2047966 RepID=UPI000D3E431D|nr:hypothetical protein [Dongshaea marina]